MGRHILFIIIDWNILYCNNLHLTDGAFRSVLVSSDIWPYHVRHFTCWIAICWLVRLSMKKHKDLNWIEFDGFEIFPTVFFSSTIFYSSVDQFNLCDPHSIDMVHTIFTIDYRCYLFIFSTFANTRCICTAMDLSSEPLWIFSFWSKKQRRKQLEMLLFDIHCHFLISHPGTGDRRWSSL